MHGLHNAPAANKETAEEAQYHVSTTSAPRQRPASHLTGIHVSTTQVRRHLMHGLHNAPAAEISYGGIFTWHLISHA
jgi:hypothetical protein